VLGGIGSPSGVRKSSRRPAARQKFDIGINPDVYKPSKDQCTDPTRSCVCARGAIFDFADLREADLMFIDAKAANFAFSDMTGSRLDGAKLQGATFIGSNLRAASLSQVVADGALIDGTDMRGAILDEASLVGAILQHVFLQASSLRVADLSYSYIYRAHFAGANLTSVKLSGAKLTSVDVYRTEFSFEGPALVESLNDSTFTVTRGRFGTELRWDLGDTEQYRQFHEDSAQNVQGVWQLVGFMRRLGNLDPKKPVQEQDAPEAKKAWRSLEKNSEDTKAASEIRKSVVREMLRRICESKADDFLVYGLTRNIFIRKGVYGDLVPTFHRA
jgi:Pentapeptide repeats (8 copies)